MSNDVPIDLALLHSLEIKATELSRQFAEQVERVQQQLRQMLESTKEASSVYKLSIKNLAQEIDSSTKKTIELITYCDELDKDLAQLHILSKQIKSVDKSLDRLQAALSEKRT
ncbi:hypothetical protein CU098_003264 [Rhizopus stolonifer]|uniref:BLOC-1-related complex subunit 6 C-terminal helix domain-containing protein n=1 Tax=Rhizopus stolonifer TaxID=4846 RepID=A0A367IZL9_RHIST|nr:hypothetical protein CU098_003264 [Rhizopus stolonifer]